MKKLLSVIIQHLLPVLAVNIRKTQLIGFIVDHRHVKHQHGLISSLRVMETLYYMRLYLSKCYPKCADYITKIPLDASRNGTEGGYYHAAMRCSCSFAGWIKPSANSMVRILLMHSILERGRTSSIRSKAARYPR